MSEVPISRERALAHESRVRLLDVLRHAERPMDAAEIAGELGLHLSTVRAHLRMMEQAGLVERQREDRVAPGRPRVLYTAAEPRDDQRPYRMLASVLAGCVTDHAGDAAAVAEQAGWRWGRDLAGIPERASGRSPEAARAVLVDVMREMGFDPVGDPDAGALELHRCPFIEVVRDHPEVVCALHLGVMRGAVEGTTPPLEVEDLLPWVDDDHCVAHLSSA